MDHLLNMEKAKKLINGPFGKQLEKNNAGRNKKQLIGIDKY